MAPLRAGLDPPVSPDHWGNGSGTSVLPKAGTLSGMALETSQDAPRRPKGWAPRRYTEQERADGLAALAAHGGNVNAAAKALGIPRPTLNLWAGTVRRGGETAVAERLAPIEKQHGAKRDLLGALDAGRWLFLEHATRPEIIAKESAYYAVQSFDKLNNAHQLLSGGATSRTELSLASFLGTLTQEPAQVIDAQIITPLPAGKGGGGKTNP